jgi:hypothetical protein
MPRSSRSAAQSLCRHPLSGLTSPACHSRAGRRGRHRSDLARLRSPSIGERLRSCVLAVGPGSPPHGSGPRPSWPIPTICGDDPRKSHIGEFLRNGSRFFDDCLGIRSRERPSPEPTPNLSRSDPEPARSREPNRVDADDHQPRTTHRDHLRRPRRDQPPQPGQEYRADTPAGPGGSRDVSVGLQLDADPTDPRRSGLSLTPIRPNSDPTDRTGVRLKPDLQNAPIRPTIPAGGTGDADLDPGPPRWSPGLKRNPPGRSPRTGLRTNWPAARSAPGPPPGPVGEPVDGPDRWVNRPGPVG